MRPLAVLVPLLAALCVNCQDKLPDVPALRAGGAEHRCTDMTGEINEAPSRVETSIVDGIGPSPTLAGMVSDADAIVVASIIGERFYVHPTCFTATLVTLAIDDLIKDHARLASPDGRLVVWRLGGKRREGKTVVREEENGYPSFKVGERYLLLLSWNESWERWDAVFPYNALRVEGLVLSPVGDYGPLTESGKGKELSEFSARLRGLAERR